MNYLIDTDLKTVKILDISEYPSKSSAKEKVVSNVEQLIKNLSLNDGAVVSFHHHLRNGDKVLNTIMKGILTFFYLFRTNSICYTRNQEEKHHEKYNGRHKWRRHY
jgi:citrate lyase alpha subunit